MTIRQHLLSGTDAVRPLSESQEKKGGNMWAITYEERPTRTNENLADELRCFRVIM